MALLVGQWSWRFGGPGLRSRIHGPDRKPKEDNKGCGCVRHGPPVVALRCWQLGSAVGARGCQVLLSCMSVILPLLCTSLWTRVCVVSYGTVWSSGGVRGIVDNSSVEAAPPALC